MITIQNPLTFTSSYPPKRLGAISDLLFFDIETTGFSGDYASVYLIGCVWHDGNTWILTQYFAETRDAEEEVVPIWQFGNFWRKDWQIMRSRANLPC